MNVIDAAKKLDSREFYGLLVSSGLLVLAVAVSFVFVPQFKDYRTQLETHSALPKVFDSLQLEQMLKEKEIELAHRSKLLHGDMANLPVREIEAFVVDRLQGIAWNHNVVLEGIKPESGDSIEPYREILFKLDIRGHYGDLFAWLHELRKELGFIVIKEYRMGRLEQNNSNPVLRVQLTIASYRREQS